MHTQSGDAFMRTTINIDDELLEQARQLTRTTN
jgi:Arc/MetJ family transcription regulator